MFKTATILLITLAVANAQYLKSYKPQTEKLLHRSMAPQSLPENWTWSNINGTNYLTTMRNQHIPQYCGSCWAHSATSVIGDRISIARGGVFPEITISPQILLDYDTNNYGCHGGDYGYAFEYIQRNGITDESCSAYRAKGHEESNANIQPYCKDCTHERCFTPKDYHKFYVDDFGPLENDEHTLMQEIYQRGPISCSVNASPLEDVPFGFTGVFSTSQQGGSNHAISLVGYGVDAESGEKYWVMRNSWGEYFADNGYIKIKRGVNMINIEQDCYWATVKNTWKDHKLPIESTTPYQRLLSLKSMLKSYNEELPRGTFKATYVKNPLVEVPIKETLTHINTGSLPQSFWWGNQNGKNYLNWNINQHIPQYCGSCWAQATAGALSDRINIKYNNERRVALAPQVLLNCGVGACTGGDPSAVYTYAASHGIPEMGCMNYTATDSYTCSAVDICRNCPFFGGGDCYAVKHYNNWKAADHGRISGVANMKREIHERGPIACLIGVTDDFYNNYKGGVYSSNVDQSLNHVIIVTGWGRNATDGEYWIGRNSWGTYWGESGYFRIKTGGNNLNIEESCNWATPELQVL